MLRTCLCLYCGLDLFNLFGSVYSLSVSLIKGLNTYLVHKNSSYCIFGSVSIERLTKWRRTIERVQFSAWTTERVLIRRATYQRVDYNAHRFRVYIQQLYKTHAMILELNLF